MDAGLILTAPPPHPLKDPNSNATRTDLRALAQAFPGQCFLGAAPAMMAAIRPVWIGWPPWTRSEPSDGAVGDVLMHRAARRPLADVMTCLREGVTIDNIGKKRLANGERRLKSEGEIARLFRPHPAAIRRPVEIADHCAFRLSDLRYQYPDEAQDGESAQARLERLPRAGLSWRYGAVRRMRISFRYPYPTAVSGGEKTAPLFKSGSSCRLIGVAVLEVALRRKVVVNRGMGRCEFLQRSHAPEPQHCPLSSSERQVRIFRAVVEPAPHFAADFCGKHWPEPVPPAPHGLMADLNPAFMQ